MNEIQHIQVSPQGAELLSLVANGREYLWQGDSLYWGRRAPILFPIVGRLAGDMLRVGGDKYHMKQHGFARDAEFVPLSLTASFDYLNGLRILPDNDPVFMQMAHEKHDNYPYDFDLRVRYATYGNILETNWEVKNIGEKPMYFQIGAHPAFMLPDYNPNNGIHGFLRCYNQKGQEILPVSSSHLEGGLRVVTATKEVDNKKGLVPITNTTFANDAILLDGGNIVSIGMIDVHGQEILRVSCPQADVFGLWAPNKPGCPFVCIEPWCGVADRQGFNGDISERDCIQRLEPEHIFNFDYSIAIVG